MGSDNNPDESPVRKVYLDGFWIYKHPVTVAQYHNFCGATGRAMPPSPGWGWLDDHPMVNVTWHDAKAYCAWAGARLPTEAEWEKAARGTDGPIYPWGETWNPALLHSSKRDLADARRTAPAGSLPAGAGPYGCLDMVGNVWEWCADWYSDGYYAHAPSKNPTGPERGTMRVLRGGAWGNFNRDYLTTTKRAGFTPDTWFNGAGFRCAMSE
jgi:formylglycine-generating enzyme required for sulfatase activity